MPRVRIIPGDRALSSDDTLGRFVVKPKRPKYVSILIFRVLFRPLQTLSDSFAGRLVAMLGIAGILHQQFARNVRAFPAVNKAFVLAAVCHWAFSVERIPVCLNASAASVCLLPRAACAM
jgi:hypothetical protein